MRTEMELLYTGSSFSSKEISFMKSDSDALSHSDFAQKHYLSDFLFKQEESDKQLASSFDGFVKDILLQLEQKSNTLSDSPDTMLDRRFTCAVVKLRCEALEGDVNHGGLDRYGYAKRGISEEIELFRESEKPSLCYEKSHMETVVHAINSALPEYNSMWQWLSDSILVITIWGDPVPAEEALRNFVNFISVNLITPCHAGAATFPFMDFLPEMVPRNAVKALDHSAFSAPGTLTFFDDVTQNIYGDRLYQLGRIEDAAREYEKGLDIKSDNLNLLNSLGVCYSLMNRLEPALDQFRKAIAFHKSGQVKNKNNALSQSPLPGQLQPYREVDGNEFMLLYNAALISSLMDDLDNGISYIKQATALTGEFFEAELTAGILLLKAGMTDESLIHLENASSLKPGSGMVHRILGELYLQTDLPAKAVNEYNLAIRLNPFDACAISGLAKAFEIQGKNLDIALDLALHSLMISPDNPWFRMRLARIYMKKGDSYFADIEFSKAKELFKASDQNFKEEVHDSLIFNLSDSSYCASRPDIKSDKMEMDERSQYDNEKMTVLKKRSA